MRRWRGRPAQSFTYWRMTKLFRFSRPAEVPRSRDWGKIPPPLLSPALTCGPAGRGANSVEIEDHAQSIRTPVCWSFDLTFVRVAGRHPVHCRESPED